MCVSVASAWRSGIRKGKEGSAVLWNQEGRAVVSVQHSKPMAKRHCTRFSNILVSLLHWRRFETRADSVENFRYCFFQVEPIHKNEDGDKMEQKPRLAAKYDRENVRATWKENLIDSIFKFQTRQRIGTVCFIRRRESRPKPEVASFGCSEEADRASHSSFFPYIDATAR